MQDMQQIIVYRNPLEAYIWNSDLGADIFVFFVCFLVLIIGVVLSFDAMEKRKLWYKYRSNISLVIGAVCAVITWYLIRI